MGKPAAPYSMQMAGAVPGQAAAERQGLDKLISVTKTSVPGPCG